MISDIVLSGIVSEKIDNRFRMLKTFQKRLSDGKPDR